MITSVDTETRSPLPSINFSTIILPAQNAASAIKVEKLSQAVLMEIICSCANNEYELWRKILLWRQWRFAYKCVKMATIATLSGRRIGPISSPIGKSEVGGGEIMHSRMESMAELCGRAEAMGEYTSPLAAYCWRPAADRRIAQLSVHLPDVTWTDCRSFSVPSSNQLLS